VSGRVIINTIIFKEKNLTYFYPRLDDRLSESNIKLSLFDNSSSEDEPSTNTRTIIKQKTSLLKKTNYFLAKRSTDFVSLLSNKIGIFLSPLSDIIYI